MTLPLFLAAVASAPASTPLALLVQERRRPGCHPVELEMKAPGAELSILQCNDEMGPTSRTVTVAGTRGLFLAVELGAQLGPPLVIDDRSCWLGTTDRVCVEQKVEGSKRIDTVVTVVARRMLY